MSTENNSQKRGFRKGQSGNPKGRPKGSPNKITTALKDAILQAAEAAGGKDGVVGYLTVQATESPQSFLPLLGKVLPMQVEASHKVTVNRVEIVALVPASER